MRLTRSSKAAKKEAMTRDDVTQHALQPMETMKPGMVVHVVEVVSLLCLRLALCQVAASIPYLHTFSAAGLGVDLESMSGISRWFTGLMPSGASVLAASPFLLFLTVIESRQRRGTEWVPAVGRMGISVLLLLVGEWIRMNGVTARVMEERLWTAWTLPGVLAALSALVGWSSHRGSASRIRDRVGPKP